MMAVRLTETPVTTFRADGTLIDLSRPDPAVVDFRQMAAGLSKLARFDGRNGGMAFSVAQHCVMGAQAILNEGGVNLDAALFLLHDGHEWLIGDLSKPSATLLATIAGLDLAALARLKAAWDEAIYAAAGLPQPSRWTKRQTGLVEAMDARMARQEAIRLFGPAASAAFPALTTPKTKGDIVSWPAAKAEFAFLDMVATLINRNLLR